MLVEFAGSLLVFWGVTLGLGWPLAARLTLGPVERLVASTALSLLGVFLLAWAVYICALPRTLLWLLPVFTLAGLGLGWRALRDTLRDAEVRSLLAAQFLVMLWCVGWLALIPSYSGGGWVADWFGHMQRTCFFLERWPRSILFNGFDALPSRPPLANVVNGAFLEITHQNFRHYQFISTLFGSLAFLPAALLARRFGSSRAIPLLAVLFMLNPLFVQNATYSWTKLPATFFTLAALYFFLRAHDVDIPRTGGVLFSVCLAAALLTHYSGGPYAVLLALAWVARGWARRSEIAWWRTTVIATLAGALVLATWFGWALAIYGWHGTFLTNTSVTEKAPTAGAQLLIIALNLRDTLVPHFFRSMDFTMFAQSSSSGWWRDWFFNLYQTNFFFIFGSVAWVAIAIMLVGRWRTAKSQSRAFWTSFVSTTAILGVAVHGGRDAWGLAHICLQPLVLLGLAFLAAHWATLGRPWRSVLVAGATLDLALGIILQFGVQDYVFDRWLNPGRPMIDLVAGYSIPAQMNFYAKSKSHWVFVGDVFAPYAALVAAILAALLLLAIARAGRAPIRPAA